uniref:Uncharacterized protein n=1 Tax=Panagrolaimus sp. JU765 TaxID=591449 RepID=A0AC34R0C5_9BILA
MPASDLECAVCGDKADGQHFGADACRACAAFFRRTIAGKMKYVCRFDNDCDINKIQSMPASDLECAVCGDKADGQHFGADACRACAAFFRRTIAGKMKYVCRFDNDCDINKTLRCMCRSCRLTKCMTVGMNPTAVQASRAPLIPPNGRQSASTSFSNDSKESKPIKRTTPMTHTSVTVIQQQQPPIKMGRCSVESNSTVSTVPSFDEEEDYVPNSTNSIFSSGETCHDLRRIIENAITTYTIDQSTLPPSYPVLTTMVVAYQDLQNRRNTFYQRNDEFINIGADTNCRIFVEKNILNIHEFAQNNRTEVEWIAAMLSNFYGYHELPLDDKVLLFKNFWIHFVILERTFDSFCVLDGQLDDNRMILQNGDVYNVETMECDLNGIVDSSINPIKTVCNPWIKTAGIKILNLMKTLRPVDIEIMFTFGYMLWNIKEFSNKLSNQTIETANRMSTILHDELFSFYNLQMTNENYVRRVSELMRLIGETEKIVSQRKEDILLSSMFNVFKIDVFLNELFEFVHT